MKIRAVLEDRELAFAELADLFADYGFGRYCEDTSLPIAAARRLVLDRLTQYLAQPDARRIAVYSPDSELIGLTAFRISRWDTEHFGFVTAIVDTMVVRKLDYQQELQVADAMARRLLDWCRDADVRFVSIRVPAKDLPVIHGLERNGFAYIESWIFNKLDLSRIDHLTRPSQALRPARPADRDLMVEYSRHAFSTQRFHADSHIPPRKADSLYEKWILTAFADPGQKILVMDGEDRPAAFMIYYPSDLRSYFDLQYAMWKMALLDPEGRHQGLGTRFFSALMYYHRDEGLNVVDSGLSTRNIASLNLHTRINFKVVTSLVTLHWWSEA